jgi:DNA-binding response OmpR family regulator
VLRHGDLELHRIEHKVSRSGRSINLTAKEFSLLEYLLLHEGECVSRSQLLAEVWQMPEQSGTNVVDVYVNYLRRKVEGEANEVIDCKARTGRNCHGLIETVRGSGYRLGTLGRKPVGRALAMAGAAYA